MGSEYSVNKPSDLEEAVKSYLETRAEPEKEKLIKIGRELVKYYAGVYSPGVVDERLKKAGSDGFMYAVKNYDPSRELLFSSYATNCIISEIRQELRNRKMFSIPDWMKRIQDEVIRATEELAQENNPLPTLQDIAEKVNISEEGIVEAMQAGSVSLRDVNLSALKSLRSETFKLPIEDVITIRKAVDRLSEIQRKVLSLISLNLNELSMAMEEEEQELSKVQAGYTRMAETHSNTADSVENAVSFKIDFPENFTQEDVLRYFEVLSDEFGLHLVDLCFKGELKPADGRHMVVPVEMELQGRYRCLLQFLNHLRYEERAVRVDRVKTGRNERVPARTNISIAASTYYRDAGNL